MWLLLGLLAVMAGFAGCSSGQTATSQTVLGQQSDEIRIGDRLLVRLTGIPDPQVLAEPVDGDGYISMPHLGRISASGKTPNQLEREIESLYKERRIYTNPNITVSQENRYVSVIGEVRSQGRVSFTPHLTALKAISDRGGFTEYAKKKDIVILRDGRTIPFNAVAALNNPKLDIPLRAGDQIQVKRTIF